MRYTSEHKFQTRQRIVESASRLFRTEGIASISVADVMADVGLTHGGFYRYFASKDDLISEAMSAAALSTHRYLSEVVDSPAGGLEGVLRAYLREVRRDTPANGCVFSLLIPELARRPEGARAPYVAALEKFTKLIAEQLPASMSSASRGKRGRMIFALMIGAMQMARLTAPMRTSDAILEDGIRAALELANNPKDSLTLARTAKRRTPRHKPS